MIECIKAIIPNIKESKYGLIISSVTLSALKIELPINRKIILPIVK